MPDGRPGPKLLLQHVAEPKAVKTEMHFAIDVPNTGHGSNWLLMPEPERNQFWGRVGGQPRLSVVGAFVK